MTVKKRHRRSAAKERAEKRATTILFCTSREEVMDHLEHAIEAHKLIKENPERQRRRNNEKEPRGGHDREERKKEERQRERTKEENR